MIEVLAMKIAIVAWTLAVPLTEPDMVLHRYWLLLDRLKQRGYGWMSYPMGYCEKCLAGQIALWVFVYQQTTAVQFGCTVETVASGVYFISVTIFSTYIISWLTQLRG